MNYLQFIRLIRKEFMCVVFRFLPPPGPRARRPSTAFSHLHPLRRLQAGVLLLLCACQVVPAAEDFVPVRGAGVAESEERAVKEAYYFVLNRALVKVAGSQAEGAVGDKFRRDFERNFDAFRKRYFSPDTDYRCVVTSSGKYSCEISGMLKVAALQTDLRKIIKKTEATLSNKLVFVLSAAKADDDRADFLKDKLEGVFVRDGHRILSGKKAKKAIKKKKVDFSLGIYEIDFTNFEYDEYEQRMTGAVSVRFKLVHMNTSQGLATIPVVVTSELPGSSAAVLKHELVANLSEKAAIEIGRRVTESVINFQREHEAEEEAEQRMESDQELYLVRLVGLTRKDRKDIKAVRKLLKLLYPDSRPKTDPGESDDTQITIVFATEEEVMHDDLIDEFYELNDSRDEFDSEYLGGNEFVLYYTPENEAAPQPEPEKKEKPAEPEPEPETEPQKKEGNDDAQAGGGGDGGR